MSDALQPDNALPRNPRVSREALAALHDAAYGWALSRTDYDEHEAQDIMQTAYVRILQGSAVFRGQSSLKTWLFGLIHGLARARRRRLWRRTRLWLRFAPSELGADASVDPVAAAADAQTTQHILRALDQLPKRQRDVVELVYYRGSSVAGAANILGMSVGSARTHFARAKQTLTQELTTLLSDD